MAEEIFPIVNEEGNVIGKATRSECHNGSMLLHPVIHLHVFNKNGKLYLQKRSETKDIQPGKWDSSVGGHISFGETPLVAVEREAFEEIGLKNLDVHFIGKHIIQTNIERELTYCFYTVTDKMPVPDQDEVVDGKFWTIEEIKEKLDTNIFTPNLEKDFHLFLSEGLEKLSNEKY